ncbi:MAG: SIMPL domain-containing protein [Melioribacteraceae bacterium]|nr:SIMPL domain-containing protein [Melioribacteraceae bacterium]MCF8395119.1 SIMPL domain-containing protein [Melioribacteraceae bacterium]MCF8420528.1 SIMPL domain-containing protein [Melioribacteraceae bacterium]
MRKIIISIILVLFTTINYCQSNDGTVFKYTAVSEIAVQADLIIFQITISEQNTDPEAAYKIHKEKESKLASLIKELGIPDSNIVYSLLSISQPRLARDNKNYNTNQKIRLKLDDFSLYEKVQIELLKMGINEFNSIFSSSDTDKIREKGITELVLTAREEAETYAEELGLKVERVIEIESRSRRLDGGKPVFFTASPEVDYSMMDIPQSYSVKLMANISFLLSK